METKFQAVCFFYFGLIYFLCQVSLFECQVIWVTRNVTDSFRIGQDGCNGSKSICTGHQASCQEDGSCLCENGHPHFRNPTVIFKNGNVQYGDSYGCLDKSFILLRKGEPACKFIPHQVIPNNHQGPATRFLTGEKPKSCKYQSAEAKYPNNNTQINLAWLNKTYIEFNSSGGDSTWYFRWKKSVPKLEGLIVKIMFHCTLLSTATGSECLQAKVFGTWRSSSTNPQPTKQALTSSQPSTSPSPTKSSSSTIAGTSSSSTIATSTGTSPNGKSPSKDDKPNTTAIAVAVVVSLLVVIIIILVVCCLLKRKKRNRKALCKRSNNHDNAHVNRGVFCGAGSDTTATTTDQTNPVKILTSEYATPDVNVDRSEVNGGNGAAVAIPADQTGPAKLLKAEYATPDDGIKRIEVNGDMYAVPVKTNEKNKDKPNEVRYMDPEKLAFDGVKDEGESSQPTEYATISGVIQQVV